MTGLTGLYDFDLTYTPELSATAAEPGATLKTALLEQLGLRLEKREMQMEVLMIEGADKVPTVKRRKEGSEDARKLAKRRGIKGAIWWGGLDPAAPIDNY